MPIDLHELEAIKRLKYKYLRCLDQKLWDEIGSCFTPDASCSYSGGKYAFDGREAIVDFLRKAMGAPSFYSSHRVHHPEIELTSDSSARATWALEDQVIETKAQITIRGAAFYHDEYVKQDGVWLIRSTGYQRTFEEMESRKDRPSLRLTQSAWEKVES
jgi:bile-acid 7alpha-dehydratase